MNRRETVSASWVIPGVFPGFERGEIKPGGIFLGGVFLD